MAGGQGREAHPAGREERRGAWVGAQVRGRPEVAAAVLYLVSPQAGYVTGTTLHVNGGMHMD